MSIITYSREEKVSVTSKELEDKLNILLASQAADRIDEAKRINAYGGTARQISIATNYFNQSTESRRS